MIEIKKENCFVHDIGLLIKCDNWEQMEQQILQDHEDAKKLKTINKESVGFMKAFNWLQENEISKIPDHPENEKNRQIVKRLEKTIEEINNLEKYFAMIFCYGVPDKFLPLGTKSYENTKPIPWINWDEVHAKLQQLLGDSKK